MLHQLRVCVCVYVCVLKIDVFLKKTLTHILEQLYTHTPTNTHTYTSMYINNHGFFFYPACDNVVIVNRTYGILESIHYPKPYSVNQRCNWTIQATAGNTVNYTFLAFELESHANCSTDYLEVCILKLNNPSSSH